MTNTVSYSTYIHSKHLSNVMNHKTVALQCSCNVTTSTGMYMYLGAVLTSTVAYMYSMTVTIIIILGNFVLYLNVI